MAQPSGTFWYADPSAAQNDSGISAEVANPLIKTYPVSDVSAGPESSAVPFTSTRASMSFAITLAPNCPGVDRDEITGSALFTHPSFSQTVWFWVPT